MALTGRDIDNVSFNRVRDGYDTKEVVAPLKRREPEKSTLTTRHLLRQKIERG